jgi:hypothetical protein
MKIEDKDILQLNAAVITGLLIFLSIGFLERFVPNTDNPQLGLMDISMRLVLTISLLGPFVASSALILLSDVAFEDTKIEARYKARLFATFLTAGGLILIPAYLAALWYIGNIVVRGTS